MRLFLHGSLLLAFSTASVPAYADPAPHFGESRVVAQSIPTPIKSTRKVNA